jgi:hypothetical protein
VTEFSPYKSGLEINSPSKSADEGAFVHFMDDVEGDLTRIFFNRLGNPSYNLGPETYHDSSYNSYENNNGFTLPSSSKFRFRDAKTARFNELACPIDNQRRAHAYFLVYMQGDIYENFRVGDTLTIWQGGAIFELPWGYGVLSVESKTRVEYADKEMVGGREYTWESSQEETSTEKEIFIQDRILDLLAPEGFQRDFQIAILEVSDRVTGSSTPSANFPTNSKTTINTTWNTLAAHKFQIQHNLDPLTSDEPVIQDLREKQFFTVHPAPASRMSEGEKVDMYHLANGYFGKGMFYIKPSDCMRNHSSVDGLEFTKVPSYVDQRYGPGLGIYLRNQDRTSDYYNIQQCITKVNGFKWVENLLSSPLEDIYERTYLSNDDKPELTHELGIDTLIGEHSWWDTEASSYAGAVSSNPFFRVSSTTGTLKQYGPARDAIEEGFAALIPYSKMLRKSPFTVQVLFDVSRRSQHHKWRINLRDYCITRRMFPETLYIRFDNFALNKNTMTIIGEDATDNSGGNDPQLLVVPGYEPNEDGGDITRYNMLEIDVVPMNPDIFPTSLPIMWSYDAFDSVYNARTGNEQLAVQRLTGSYVDYGYELMTVGQDFYYDDGTNTAETNYPITQVDEEYSKCYRENSLRLVSTYSEWKFPTHLSELPAISTDRDSTTAFGIREPSGHRIIVTNINCVVPSSP